MLSLIVPKSFGKWENNGECQVTGDNPACRPGIQLQERTCINETDGNCIRPADTQRSVSCAAAGTQLTACSTGKELFEIFISSTLNFKITVNIFYVYLYL